MSELVNFPFINQRTDGNRNAEYNCVPASLAASANYLLGSSVVNDSSMKNLVYGDSYIGGTSAQSFVDYLGQYGLKLHGVQGNYRDLLARAHQELAKGHPVIFTRDDPYSSNPDMTHVCVWYKDTSDSLTCMDPYGALSITMHDAQWLAHLREKEIWIMEKAMLSLDSKFKQVGTNPLAWQCLVDKHPFVVLGGILNFYRQIEALGLPNSGEKYDLQDYVYQEFQNGIVLYSKKTNSCTLVDLRSDLAKRILGNTGPDLSELHAQLVGADAALKVVNTALTNALAKI